MKKASYEAQQSHLKSIGNTIRHHLRMNGISVSELAEKSGVNRTVVYKVLNGSTYNVQALIKLIFTLNLDISINEQL